ncbi:mycofactocin biosynthesis glycosyltransferase MftF [Actinomadura parmotrematis]|uniref:Mycofactocin biosynthesis glycosyltransferase MftF n=1 Tax=Actinomadura parmotrematis TaxID=2864039 RepID=A0ABS7FQK6_9ACTN|nr:mycofactocin biosynthesis glycosyltransferase MftF [Actinomadura parmotrematis]MBW8482688.1 mycofactocin biosynthesis glycosyltransferase MftF [Actinomadura parmotrematis]
MTTIPVTRRPPPLPDGFAITLDDGARQLTDELLFGGSPARVLRLTAAGRAAWCELETGPVASPAAGALARRLTDAGLAHPVPPPGPDRRTDLTVVIPVRDRPVLLDRCLTALGGRHLVIVVDDGSRDPDAVARAVHRHGATLIRRPVNGGPGAARDTALEAVTSDLVAFIDSDCVPPPGWADRLAAHFADPAVAAVAPCITARADGTGAGRFARANESLGLGGQPGRVVPRTRISYVPTAALVARAAALTAVARDGAVFDAAMRVGEDVDLVWRLHEQGWRIRYDPAVRVGHHEPPTWRGLLERRFRYGTSVAPLAQRHPGAVPPLVLHPWPAVTVAALLAGRPFAAAAAFGASNLVMLRTLRQAGVPTEGTPRAMLDAVRQTWLGTGRYATQFAAPALAALIVAGGRRRRLAAASLLLGPAFNTWRERRPDLGPARYALGSIADDVAYGAGVWTGCWKARTLAPVRPLVAWRPLRIDRPQTAVTPERRRSRSPSR